MTEPRCVLFHDNFQNFKSYNIPKAQLVIADIPYNIGSDFYASRPDWYVDGDSGTNINNNAGSTHIEGLQKFVVEKGLDIGFAYETLMFRESGDARTNFVLFSYAGKFLKEQSVRVGVINNIWLFIPLGTGLYRWFQKKWVLLIPFVMSVAIETTQYITGLGIAEFDDVFGNTMGGWIGVLVAWTWLSRKMSVKNRA